MIIRFFKFTKLPQLTAAVIVSILINLAFIDLNNLINELYGLFALILIFFLSLFIISKNSIARYIDNRDYTGSDTGSTISDSDIDDIWTELLDQGVITEDMGGGFVYDANLDGVSDGVAHFVIDADFESDGSGGLEYSGNGDGLRLKYAEFATSDYYGEGSGLRELQLIMNKIRID